MLEALQEDENRYGGRPDWDDWIRRNRDSIDFQIRNDGLTVAEVSSQVPWPTLGKYISERRPGGLLTPHQEFLKTFTYGNWREYSAMAHGGFDGLMRVAMYYISDSFMHDERPKVEELFPKILATHIGRAAVTLLCMVTELQAYFRFDGGNINERINQVWQALMPVFEVKELYDERYAQLMRDKGIHS